MCSLLPRSEDVVHRKRNTRTEALKAAPIPLESHLVYLRSSASEIPRRIKAGEWTASGVLEAYISQAAVAQATTNCLTEVLFEEAREEARTLDQHFYETQQLKGPLHGVPVSFKDLFDITGYDSTVGLIESVDRPAIADAEIVRFVRQAGGIPFVKTTISQGAIPFECTSPIWGRTLNPFSKDHTCGGTTGGEAALLAMDGSALGWGTDIGGSLRIPASYCGVYSFKPGYGRVGTMGTVKRLPGFEAVRIVCGPMSRSVEDLELACRVVFGQPSENYDPPPLPFRTVLLPKKLRFGYYISDDFIKASPVCKRAVLETVEALRREGHECVEFAVPASVRAMKLFLALMSSDGSRSLFSPLSPETQESDLHVFLFSFKLFGWMQSFAAWIAKKWFHDHVVANMLQALGMKSVREFWALTHELQEYARMFNQEVWEKYRFDGIIAPVQAIPALPHESMTYVASLSVSTILYSIVDSPVGTIPVTRVDPALDGVTAEWSDPEVDGGHGSPLIERLIYNGKRALYNPQSMAGLPVGVQIIGKKWEEEKVIEMMKVVDRALGERGFGPGHRLEQKAIPHW